MNVLMIRKGVKAKYIYIIGGLFLLATISSCDKYTPKPRGYNRIDSVETKYTEYKFSAFLFKYSAQAYIDTLQAKTKSEVWFNIVYPKYNAIIYCTYLPISKSIFPQVLDDSYKLAYSHSLKADKILHKNYVNDMTKVSGTIYSIEGSVATPIQFYLTDSLTHFFRGSFYYKNKVNPDSVAPITEFVLKDIQYMIDSFRWENK